MTDHAATPHGLDGSAPVEGRRKLAPFGNDFPEHAPQATEPTRPVEDAFTYTTDRIDRAEHMAGNMQGTIQRLARRLKPLLTGGTYGYPDAPGDPMLEGSTPEDRRSTIAKRITGAGDRVDQLADLLGRLDREVEALLDAMEV